MRITEFQIDRYGPLPRIQETCDDGITVFHGPNESGKTLLLESVLKLLDPGIDAHYPRIQRVDESPSGYVVVETADGEEKLGDGTTLPDISPVEAAHLRNIFTVRDSDLSLHDQHAFYDSLTEQIGDLHTSEIEAIRDEFLARGRLTPGHKHLSNRDEYHDAKDVRDQAEGLAERIADYVEEAAAEDLDDTERQLLRTKRERRTCRERLEFQRRARTVAEHDRLSDRLETFRVTSDALDERYPFSQDELRELTSLDQRVSRAAEDIEAAKGQIEDQEAIVAEAEEALAEKRAERETLERRGDRVAAVEAALEAFRADRADTEGSDRWLQTTARIGVIGLLLGGLTASVGAFAGNGVALVVATVLVLVGVAGSAAWLYRHRQVSALESAESALVASARDAGFEVESVAEIPPAIESYRGELAAVDSRIDELNADLRVANERIDDHEGTIEDARSDREEAEDEKRAILRQADVEDFEAYREALEDTTALERDQSNASQSLADAFGRPGGDDSGPGELEDFWAAELADVVDDVDTEGIDPEEYVEEELAELERRAGELDDQVSQLETQLEEHEQAIRGFKDDAQGVRAEPFVGSTLTLRSETVDGLEQLRRDLEALVSRIDRDAEISRVGLAIFDEIHDEEEEKITDLFEGNSRATEIFERITQGRYTDVTYDTDQQALVVEDRDGRTLRPVDLSHGTREQLFFATRVSLSEELLGSEPGFFILDDAFLPADRTRLEEGFEVLTTLAEDDWQIVYLTAKHEVGVEMVESFDLPCTKLDPLP